MSERYAPIADYALLGDCHGAALVSRSGSIDWACLRRVDAGSIFGRLLDADRGGSFAITPVERFATTREYVTDTMVLDTRFETATGDVRLLDALAMRAGGRHHPLRQLLRVIEGVRGVVELDVTIVPRFDYGALRPWLHVHQGGGGTATPPRLLSALGGDEAIVISTDIPLVIEREAAAFTARIRVAAGERRYISLVWNAAHDVTLQALSAKEIDRRLAATIAWWRDWTAKGRTVEPYPVPVTRSALVLKALTTAPTGAIVAAPTTSLPEAIGGNRNWDYRYCWVRDAAFTIAALHEVGHEEEATEFRRFLTRAAAGHADDMQILYGCYGERRTPEVIVGHLAGYRDTAPVRVGNGASEQRQLDVYGEFVGAIWLSQREGEQIGTGTWRFLRSLIDTAAQAWRQRDQGIWEVRGPARHFVHSKVMCWLALDCGIRLATALGRDGRAARWRATRDAIRSAIYTHGIDPTRGCFVQSFGSTEVDASLLMLPRVGFVDAGGPIMVATVAAIERDLVVDGFVRRYRPQETDDGVGGREGAFLMCSFWLVDVWAKQGRLAEARALYERLLSLANDVGLYAEQYDPHTGEMLGNFPQAFTHVAVINSARVLHDAEAAGR